MAEITAARINNLQSRIELVLGNGSGQTGYGQTLESTQVLPGDIIDADHVNALYADIIKARIHQVGPSHPSVTSVAELLENQNVVADETSFIVNNSGLVSSDPDGTKKGISDFEDLMSLVEIDKVSIDPSQAGLITAATSTRTSTWNGLIYHEFIVTFFSSDARRHFFNTGGQIRLDPSNTNASTPKGLDWAALTNEIGIISFDANGTSASSGSGAAIGNFDLTTTYQTVYSKIGSGSYSGIYAGNTFQLKARAISGTQISFRAEFNDVVTDNLIDNNVDGTLRSVVSLYRATGEVSVPAPGVFTSVDLTGSTPGSGPRYILTPSVSAVNEGSPFTVTLSTFNVASGTNVPYTISGVTADDLLSGSLTGTFVLNGAGVAVATFSVLADEATEGIEFFDIALDNNQATARVTVNDTSTEPTEATYVLSPSSVSINEGGTISFTLTTTNITNGTQVPFTISGIEREDLADGTYDWDDWYDEFRQVYWDGFTKAEVLLTKDIVLPYYTSNNEYSTSLGTRYGLFRNPGAAGIAYWVNDILSLGQAEATFRNNFFYAASLNTIPLEYLDYSGGESDATRSLTNSKDFIAGTDAGVAIDRGTPGGSISAELTDYFTVYSNTAVKNYNVVADYLTEGNQTMTVALDNGKATASITVNDTSIDETTPDAPIAVPVVNSFAWNRSPAYWGDPVFTSWDVSNADSINVSISGLGIASTTDSTNATGSSNVIVLEEADGTGNLVATLTATNAGGSVSATTEIPVSAPLPTISAFYSDPLSEVEIGDPLRLVYATANAITASITTDFGVNYSSLDLPSGTTGATVFDGTNYGGLGTKTATLSISNASNDTLEQTITFNVVNTVEPVSPSWLVAPEWAGLFETVAFGTTGRGFLQATGDIDSVEYTVTKPDATTETDVVDYTPGDNYYTPNISFSQQGAYTISMTVSGSGGSLTASDTVTVLPPA